MAASLTITFDENKYQIMLQEKQSKRTFKRPASCRSVTSLGNPQNTGSTSSPRTIVFGSLGPFPLPIEDTALAKKQKIAFNVSLPRHQRRSPRNLRLVAIPRGLNLQKTRSAPRLGPHDLHQNKEDPGHLQSQHTWLLSRRPGSILLHTSKERNLPSTKTPKLLSTSRLAHTSPKSSPASHGLDKSLLGPALLQLDPSSQQGPSLRNLKLHCDRLRTASKSCPCQSSRKTSSAAAHEGPRPSLPEHSPS